MKAKSAKDNRQTNLLLPIGARSGNSAGEKVVRAQTVDCNVAQNGEAARKALLEKLRNSGHLDLRKK